MKKIFLLALFAIEFAHASPVAGIVVVGERGCQRRDYIVIDTAMGYVYAQQYAGNFDKGDKVVGELNTYGFKDVRVNSSTGRLWIDDFAMSKTRVSEKCFGT